MSTDYEGADRWACYDCGHCTARMGEYYMLHDAVWLEARGPNPYCRMLCIGCVERRLGRALTIDDFALAAVNFDESCCRSLRFRHRLTVVDAA